MADPRRWRILLVLLVGQAMATLDGAIVTVAMPSIEHDLHASGADLQLLIAAYLLTFGALVVTGARLGDQYGHRRVFLAGICGFTVASLLCGLAPNVSLLIVARLIQGAAGAMMVPQVLSGVQLYFEGEERARAISLYSMVLALGVLGGQVLGGAITSLDLFGLGWRPVFLVNLPVGAVVAVYAARLLPKSERATPAPLDLGGVVLLGGSMAALLIPLSVGREQGWPSWTFASVGTACIGTVALVQFERRRASQGSRPLVDLSVLAVRGVAPALLAACVVMGSYTVVVFTLSLHWQGALGYSAIQSGGTFAFYAAGFAIASLGWHRLPKATHRLLPLAGLFAFTIGAVALAHAVRSGWSLADVPLLTLTGAGHAVGFSPLLNQTATRVDPRWAPEISGLMTTMSLLAGVVGISTLGGVYFSAVAAGTSSADAVDRVLLLVAALMVAALAAALRATRREPAGETPPERGSVSSHQEG